MSSPGLNVIALISGGKDSLFSLLHCLANGHKIVALANLHPPAPDGTETAEDDIESYMYQTVGHQVIPLYAQALDLPLYREPIHGSAVNDRREYTPALLSKKAGEDGEEDGAQDETESLIPLLRRVIQDHPEANAVSTGAILSTYQRTRVESVALRLGLVPLSYLWQFPYLPPHRQGSLLEDMNAVRQRAVIVKVASGGLGTHFLGENVADPKTVKKITKSMVRFGSQEVGNVLGEGGEFETLAVEGPGPLWKGRIVFDESKVVEGEGGSAILRIDGARVVLKKQGDDNPACMPRKPDLFEGEFQTVLEDLLNMDHLLLDQFKRRTSTPSILRLDGLRHLKIVVKECPREVVHISNLHCTQHGLTAAEQMRHVIGALRIMLELRWSLTPSAIVFASILLRRMADFGAVNIVYGSLFRDPNPPARATIACGELLLNDVDVILSVTVDLCSAESRSGLHVQSRSYWAPANIGPYSQAIAVPATPSSIDSPQIVYVAGQIPLVPSSMEPISAEQCDFELKRDIQQPTSTFKMQTVLALQHLWRIGRSMNVQCWTGGIAFISHCPSEEAEEQAAVAASAWDAIHSMAMDKVEDPTDEPGDFDVWHARNNYSFVENISNSDTRPPLPNLTTLRSGSSIPLCFIVQVQELPRSARIEWLSTGISSAPGGSVEQHCVFQTTLSLHCTRVRPDGPVISYIGLRQASSIAECAEHLLSWIPSNSIEAGEMVHIFTVYAVSGTSDIPWAWIEEHGAEVVPCWRIWQGDGIEVEALVVLQSRRQQQVERTNP